MKYREIVILPAIALLLVAVVLSRKYIVGKSEAGSAHVSSMDPKLQQAAEKVLKNYKGTIVILKVPTGEVLAVVSHPDRKGETLKPTYDAADQAARIHTYMKDAMSTRYPPGSLWEIIAASLLLHHKDLPYVCKGKEEYKGVIMRCAYIHHNISGIEDAFVKACNNYFFKRGLAEIPVKNFVRMTETFSGHAVNIANNRDYAEALAGQDKVSLSPMEGAVLAETIASGGMKPTPSLFKGDHRNMRVFSEQVAHKLREFMKRVVSEGTASSLSHLVMGKYQVGVKTGTVIQKDASGKDKTVAWMIGS